MSIWLPSGGDTQATHRLFYRPLILLVVRAEVCGRKELAASPTGYRKAALEGSVHLEKHEREPLLGSNWRVLTHL